MKNEAEEVENIEEFSVELFLAFVEEGLFVVYERALDFRSCGEEKKIE